jgi:hypothetical protein
MGVAEVMGWRKEKSRSLTPLAKCASGFGMTSLFTPFGAGRRGALTETITIE